MQINIRMKKYLLLFVFALSIPPVVAQKTTIGPLKEVVQDVLRSSAEDFIDIRGEQIGGDPGTIQFLSTKEVPGSLENKVIGYSGLKKTDWVWESKLATFEKIEDLQSLYKKIYNEIGRGSVKSNSKTYESVNSYDHPNERQRIWKNQFKAVESNMMIDLVAEEINYEWVIWLRIYNLENSSGGGSLF